MSPSSEKSLGGGVDKHANIDQMDSDRSGEKPVQERVEDVRQSTSDEESQQEPRVSWNTKITHIKQCLADICISHTLDDQDEVHGSCGASIPMDRESDTCLPLRCCSAVHLS